MPSMSLLEQAFCRSTPWRAFTRRVVLPWVLRGVAPAGDVLELGGGSGTMAAETLRRFPDLRLTMTDVDAAMVDAARRRLAGFPRATAQEADATALPFADSSFDVVASYLMLHHVIDWEGAVAEASRVLRPGGVLIGYDLLDTRLAELLHRADRSPHRLIRGGELAALLPDLGLGSVWTRHAFGGHVVRFIARKQPTAIATTDTPAG